MFAVPAKRGPAEIVRHGDALVFVAWKIQPERGWIGRVTTRGKFKMHAVPEGHIPGLTTRAPDSTLWLSDAGKQVLWRVDAKGNVTMVPKPGALTQGIAFGPDGHLWCTHIHSPYITRYDTNGVERGSWRAPSRNAPMTSSTVPPLPGPKLTFIIAGPDGAMWFSDQGENRIGRITMNGEITMFDLPQALFDPRELVTGGDGAVWFAVASDKLGRITTKGEVSMIDIPTHYVMAVDVDDRGRVWWGGQEAVGWVDMDRTVHKIELPDVSIVRSIAVGPDGKLWFVDEKNGRIGSVSASDASASPLPRSATPPR